MLHKAVVPTMLFIASAFVSVHITARCSGFAVLRARSLRLLTRLITPPCRTHIKLANAWATSRDLPPMRAGLALTAAPVLTVLVILAAMSGLFAGR
jgi:hypothetical protein